MSNSTEKEGRTNEISLSLDLINVKDLQQLQRRCFETLIVCPCLLVANTTLLAFQTSLFLFFSKICASKLGVRLIHGRSQYIAHIIAIICIIEVQRFESLFIQFVYGSKKNAFLDLTMENYYIFISHKQIKPQAQYRIR